MDYTRVGGSTIDLSADFIAIKIINNVVAVIHGSVETFSFFSFGLVYKYIILWCHTHGPAFWPER